MALFRKDRDKSDLPKSGDVEMVAPARSEAQRTDPSTGIQRQDRGGVNMSSSYPSSSDKGLDPAQASAFLGRGTRIAGKITFEGPARIEGQVEGEVIATDSLLVGETALLNAQITGATVVIQGKVTGDITASKRLEIRAPGRVYGNVTTPSLVIEEGVVFEGHCSMGTAENRGNKVTLLAKEDKPQVASPSAPLKAQGDVK